MTQRRLTFGAVAEAYEQFRPGYPDAVVDVVLDYAARPVRSALEIGAGTGKATRVFARREIIVTATDPDPAMLVELRRHLPVATRALAFEQLPLDSRYDLVFAAASLHWTTAADRWPRVAALLVPGGVFANLGGGFELADPELAAAAADARSGLLPDAVIRAPQPHASGSALRWPGNELADSSWFTDVRQVDIPRRLELSADEYIGYLGTVSAFLTLSASDRRTVFANVRAVLPAQVSVAADVDVHLARLC